jgi:hypothetical protein
MNEFWKVFRASLLVNVMVVFLFLVGHIIIVGSSPWILVGFVFATPVVVILSSVASCAVALTALVISKSKDNRDGVRVGIKLMYIRLWSVFTAILIIFIIIYLMTSS